MQSLFHSIVVAFSGFFLLADAALLLPAAYLICGQGKEEEWEGMEPHHPVDLQRGPFVSVALG